MRTLHLFAGAGGGLLADLILGHQPIAAVEWEPYACEVLRERRDEGWFPGLQVHEGDVRLFDPSQYAGKVDCIHAGFPCQDISTAGKGAGITGTRSGLVREVFRAIDAIRPRFVFLENSPAIRTRGRHVVLGELVARGYAYRDGILAAFDVGACHKRARWWCLAYSNRSGQYTDQRERQARYNSWRSGEDVANSMSARERWQQREEKIITNDVSHSKSERHRERREVGNLREADGRQDGELFSESGCTSPKSSHPNNERLEKWNWRETKRGKREPAIVSNWWSTEPAMGRVAHGLANRVDRIKAIGNGQVPLQAAVAWRLLGGP